MNSVPASVIAPERPTSAARPPASRQSAEFKSGLHRKLMGRLNLEALAVVDRARGETELRTLISDLLLEEGAAISAADREQLYVDLIDEVFGLGPLEPLLRDPSISDILVNTQ